MPDDRNRIALVVRYGEPIQTFIERRLEVGMSMIFCNRRALPPEIIEAYEAELRRRDTDPWVADAVEPVVASSSGYRMLLPIHRYRAYTTLHHGAMVDGLVG